MLSLSGSHRTEIGFERSEKALGQGAFGKVWLGLRDNGEFLAIKEIQISQGEKYAQRLEAVENEIELMRNFDHPHIVRYLGSQRDEARGVFYILLEYVSCGSIQALLKTMGGPLDEKVIRKYARQILLGLAYLHSRSPPVAHRDIKSANVLVETTGNVKLADFGCSKVFSDLVEGANFNSVLGTPHWMAPEVIRQEGAGLAADIWSFGCTVVEMATGLPPWSHIRDPTAVMFHIASATELPQIPESLSDIGQDFLKCCFQRDPARRATAVDLLQHSFVSSDYVANSNFRDIQNSDDYYNSLLTQSLSTIPQFLSVLPANLVVFIFQFLAVKDLCAVSLVCKQWRAAAAADSLWEVKSKTKWPWLESSKGNRWRDVFVKATLGNQGWKGSGKLMLDTLRGHGKAVLCMEASKDRLLTGGEDKKIRVWSVSKRKCTLTLKGHLRAVAAVCSQGEVALSGGVEGSIRLWDISGKGKCLRVMDGGSKGVTGVDMVTPACVSVCEDGLVKFWNVETGKSTLSVQCNVAVTSVRLDGPNRAIWSCNDGSLRVCDVRTKGETGIMMGHADVVTKVQLGKKLSVDPRSGFSGKDLICSCSLDGTVKLWDLRSLKAYSTLSTAPGESLYSVDFNGSIVACAGKSKTLHVFDLASEESIRSLKQHHTDTILGVSVGRHQIFTCSRDKTIKTLSSASGLSMSGAKMATNTKPRTASSFLRLPFQQSAEKIDEK
jgi:mitogen-activated protein kinase kinase kinase